MDKLLLHLTSLRQGITKYGLAPHKPIMLLAIADGFEKGTLWGKEVPISEELLTIFHDYWKLLVDTQHTPNFSLPFFHLSSESSGIWKLKCWPGKTVPLTKSHSIKSFRALRETVETAILSDELAQGLQDPVQRLEIKAILLERYFPGKLNSLTKTLVLYSESVTKEILYDPSENYARKVIRQYEQMESVAWEEEMILRSHVFKKAIVEVYNGRCAISGMKLEFGATISMVDACHIVPFAQSYDDTIHNGIALSPTLHRAFDRGLVSVSDDYRVLVHPRLRDHYPQVGIQQFNGQELILPPDSRFYPSREKLGEHRKRYSV